ncbi:GPI-anchored surface protein, putative [Bodo saltans]|uniref:GPI-anchored surface protein, putative n=1 Tax=Bodo saltans TaxID=75058 RepID=A0A0S4IJP5_BODSA|nr:GPI-anchored surface protein, putative [Bodo saltans]|eukprot:CUE56127.1 GPI-anchored surface protein, putative [Bodo saltans]
MTSPDSTIATRIGNLHLLFQVKFPATSLLVRVTANTSGGLQMIINNNTHSCTTCRVDQQLWMEHTVLPTEELMTRCVITAASLIAAAYDETSGDELWAVKDGHGNVSLQFVPFSIGRQTIGVTDLGGVVGNRVHVEFSSRGRDGVFYTRCTNFSEKQTHRRAIMGSHAASHPLLPCLRELVATALIGLVTFAECKCAWTSPQQGATSVVPTEVVLNELAVPFHVTMPLISLHLCGRGE